MITNFIRSKIKSAIKELVTELLDLAKDAEIYAEKDSEGKMVYGIKVKKEW